MTIYQFNIAGWQQNRKSRAPLPALKGKFYESAKIAAFKAKVLIR
jgi:hypothetical protein